MSTLLVNTHLAHVVLELEVQQRGVPATVAVLEQCIQGLKLPKGTPVHLFDLLPNQFGEWSKAVWKLQLDALNLPSDQVPEVKWTYTGYFTDQGECDAAHSAMAGRAMEDWCVCVCVLGACFGV